MIGGEREEKKTSFSKIQSQAQEKRQKKAAKADLDFYTKNDPETLKSIGITSGRRCLILGKTAEVGKEEKGGGKDQHLRSACWISLGP